MSDLKSSFKDLLDTYCIIESRSQDYVTLSIARGGGADHYHHVRLGLGLRPPPGRDLASRDLAGSPRRDAQRPHGQLTGIPSATQLGHREVGKSSPGFHEDYDVKQ